MSLFCLLYKWQIKSEILLFIKIWNVLTSFFNAICTLYKPVRDENPNSSWFKKQKKTPKNPTTAPPPKKTTKKQKTLKKTHTQKKTPTTNVQPGLDAN